MNGDDIIKMLNEVQFKAWLKDYMRKNSLKSLPQETMELMFAAFQGGYSEGLDDND